IISGHPNGESIVKNGEYSGYSLSKLWHEKPLLFGENNTENRPFPLLVKILDANLDLSVQVHPDDNYAKKHHGELGKTESWYIIDTKPNAEICYGHNAMTS
ncbi:type I phosphomannose isomerase catalytic subunit, partial [Enterobacter cloacae complex sp.6701430]|uniref:type I phosphomannose isomerase catalytic subunit n=1 Tax=Enterobacter cloacae complex sp.6701430 TaxID=3397176 RepID=UPI003AACFD9E